MGSFQYLAKQRREAQEGKENCIVDRTQSIEQKLLVSRSDLKQLGVTVSNCSLLRWEAQGRFPRRVRMAGTTVAWASDEVIAWYRKRLSERVHHHYADACK